MMKKVLVIILVMSFSYAVFAAVNFKIYIENDIVNKEVKIKNVRYKIKGSSWENVTKGGQILNPNGGHRVFTKTNIIMTGKSDRVWQVRLQCVGEPEFKVEKTCKHFNPDSIGSNTYDTLVVKGCSEDQVGWMGGC
ncbi:hypothetical protein ACFL17_06460 [Pseudomonadota bacterium]